LDTVYWKTFHISSIGVRENMHDGYRQSMLTNTVGVMPKNIKVGFAAVGSELMAATEAYYDYLPNMHAYQTALDAGRATDMPIGTHLNAIPWNDSADQSKDILQNYLEKYDGGALLQQDRQGRIRDSAMEQDPTIDEQASGDFPQLEMQLSLSPYAPLVLGYVQRNTRMLARYFAWLREEAPDVVTYCTLTSETGQNILNDDFCDYSEWSRQEFRDWLSGSGLYEGDGQFSSLTELNDEYSGASGFPYTSWDEVEPPMIVNWGTGAGSGLWWNKWHEFRIAQVQHFEQAQMSAAREAGWSPDRLFGHQQPGIPDDINSTLYRKKASPWTTTFVNEGGNGVTTYKENACDTDIFDALYANDKSWGLVEYNPKTNNLALNVQALETVWDAHARIICPFHWSLTDDAKIMGSEFETALQQFISTHSDEAYSGMAEVETAAESRSVLWSMSYPSDVEASSGWSSLTISTGVCYATLGQEEATMSLDLDESRHVLESDGYYALSARMFFSNAPSGDVVFQWTDPDKGTGSVSIPVEQGWNRCRVNLAERPAWREKQIQDIQLTVAGGTGNQFRLDWVQLEAGPCWNFNDPNEVTSANNFSEWSVSDGSFSGTGSTSDHFFYLSTDADRRFIDTDVYERVRIRMTSSVSGTGQFYWWSEEVGYQAENFAVSAGTQTVELNLSTTANWSGLVSKLRLDPVNQAGATCSVDTIALSPLVLSPRSPVYDSIINSPHPVFSWDAATEPDGSSLRYDFQLATDFGFTNEVFSLTDLSASQLTYLGPELDGQYWWRARVQRADTGTASSWMVPMPVFIRTWDCSSTHDFVSLHGFTNAVVSNGIWSAQTGSDPYFKFNNGAEDASAGINADIYKRLQFRVRVDASVLDDRSQIWFYPEAGGSYWIQLEIPSDGEWHEITVDLSEHANWTGAIDSVRLDPTVLSDATVFMDWAQLLPVVDGDSDGDGQDDEVELANGRDPYDASDLAFHFNTDGDFEGWTQWSHVTGVAVSNGAFSARSATTDPCLGTTNCAVNSTQIKTMLFKLHGETNGLAAFYWKHDGQSAWNVKIVQYTNAPNWQVCVFDVSTSSAWTGIIDQLRVDPVNVADQSFSFDWILASDGDRDNDGIPDAADGFSRSGSSGLENFLNPDAASSPLQIEGLNTSSGRGAQMQLNGYAGYTYTLQKTGSLIVPDWMTVQSVGPLLSDQTLFFEDSAPLTNNVYYRISSDSD
jgi:hypothetical protein